MAESATKLKTSPSMVRMLISIGDLPGVRMGGGRIVVGSSRLEEWIASKMADTSTLVTPKSGQELIATVLEAKHHTVVLYPSVTVRGLWRRAIWQASNEKLVPAGLCLRYAGRDDGALVVWLAPATEKPPREPAPVIEVPSVLVRRHPVVAATRAVLTKARSDRRGNPSVIDPRRTAHGPGLISTTVTVDLVPRALRIAQALLSAAEARGWEIDATEAVSVAVGDFCYRVEIEEVVKRGPHQPTPAELRARSYPPSYDYIPTGLLKLSLPASYGERSSWKDGARQRLEDLLGEVALAIGQRAERDEAAREKARADAKAQAEAHERARQEARRRLREEQLGRILDERVASWERAERIRRWLRAAEDQLEGHDVGDGVQEWLAWASDYADQIDSLSPVAGMPVLAEPTSFDLDRYLSSRR